MWCPSWSGCALCTFTFPYHFHFLLNFFVSFILLISVFTLNQVMSFLKRLWAMLLRFLQIAFSVPTASPICKNFVLDHSIIFWHILYSFSHSGSFLCWIWFALFFPSRSANTLCIMHICIAGPWILFFAFLPAFCMFAFAFECLCLVFSLAYFYFCSGHCLLGPAMPIHPNAHALCIAPMSPAPP